MAPRTPEQEAQYQQALLEAEASAEVAKVPKTKEETFGQATFSWQESIIDALKRDTRAAAKDAGFNQDLADGLIDQYGLQTVNYLESIIKGWDLIGPRTALHYNMLLGHARTYLSSKSDMARHFFLTGPPGKNPGQPGSPGSRGLTAAEIRQSFDMDELSRTVTQLYQGMLFDEPRDPRGLAKAYVDAIVANPDQKLDFESFVTTQIEKEPRYAAIYANKPAGMTAGQFMAPYMNSAAQVLRPSNAGEAARAGAQLGSSPDAFREKLGRSREAQVSTPFITGLENRITQLGNLFKTQ